MDRLFTFKNLKIFVVGAAFYGTLEIVYRGGTHWTMPITGGVCFLILFYMYDRNKSAPLWLLCLKGALIITIIEFAAGCLFNLWLGWNVWSYSNYPFNLLGQICLPYTILWFMLCMALPTFIRFLRIRE